MQPTWLPGWSQELPFGDRLNNTAEPMWWLVAVSTFFLLSRLLAAQAIEGGTEAELMCESVCARINLRTCIGCDCVPSCMAAWSRSQPSPSVHQRCHRRDDTQEAFLCFTRAGARDAGPLAQKVKLNMPASLVCASKTPLLASRSRPLTRNYAHGEGGREGVHVRTERMDVMDGGQKCLCLSVCQPRVSHMQSMRPFPQSMSPRLIGRSVTHRTSQPVSPGHLPRQTAKHSVTSRPHAR